MKVDAAAANRTKSEWDDFMAKLDAAELEFAQGRPDAFKSLWSHTNDVTLCGGLGGAIEVGYENVAARLDWASSNYAGGRRSRREVSCKVASDFAYLVQNEIIEARMGGETKRSRQELRVTMIVRRGSEGWRIVHRPADSQTSVSTPK